MRPALSLLLIVLLASCPIVCGTAHALAGDQDTVGHHHGPNGKSSLPAPANDDDCLCNGAIKATNGCVSFDLDGQSIDAICAFIELRPTCLMSAVDSLPFRSSPSDDVCGGARRPFLRC